jgi:hypothetical protein
MTKAELVAENEILWSMVIRINKFVKSKSLVYPLDPSEFLIGNEPDINDPR